MKKIFLISLAFVSLTTIFSCSEKKQPTVNKSDIANTKNSFSYVTNDDIKMTGIEAIKKISKKMKPMLQSVLKQDPTGASGIAICSAMSKSMEENQKNSNEKVKVRRASLKYRNANNSPDKIDTDVLNKIKESKNFKMPLVVKTSVGHRVYKPIAIKKPCLSCHGTNINKDTAKEITKLYPNDNATGYEIGQLRGVMIAEILSSTK